MRTCLLWRDKNISYQQHYEKLKFLKIGSDLTELWS